MPIVKADRLTRVSAALLRAAGASEEEADAVAVGCVNANLAGHDSHGVIAIPTYIDRIKAGHIVPGAKWTIVQESPTTTVIDGHWGFGFYVNAQAMELTIEKARTANVAACTVFRQSHVGRLAAYPMMAMRQGMIGIATADSGRSPSTSHPSAAAKRGSAPTRSRSRCRPTSRHRSISTWPPRQSPPARSSLQQRAAKKSRPAGLSIVKVGKPPTPGNSVKAARYCRWVARKATRALVWLRWSKCSAACSPAWGSGSNPPGDIMTDASWRCSTLPPFAR